MDTTHLQQQISEVFDNFIKSLSQLSNETLNTEPKQGTWTIGQLAQHVILATSGLPDTKTKPAERKYDQLEQEIKDVFLNFEMKATSPGFIAPEKKMYTMEYVLTQLKKNKIILLSILKEKELTELCLDVALPNWGNLTRYEWIKLIIYHVQRHTVQLKKLQDSLKK